MKSVFRVLILISAVLLLNACSSQASIEVSCDDFDQNSNQTGELAVPVGKEFTLTLCSNPTTGFQWSEEVKISDEGMIAQVNHVLVPPSGGEDDPPPGAAGEEVWTFKSLQAGKSTVSLEYSRPWEGGEKGTWTYVLTVEVK
jgi:predicted secreted protein